MAPLCNASEYLRNLTILITSCISPFDITSVVVSNPEVPDPKIFYKFLHLPLMLLLLVQMVSIHFWLMGGVHFL